MSGVKLSFYFDKQNNTGKNDKNSPSPAKRSVRNRNKPKKYGYYLDLPQDKRGNEKGVQNSDCDTDNDFDEDSHLAKTKALTLSDNEVEEEDELKSRHAQSSIHNKLKKLANNSTIVPESPIKTPKNNRYSITAPNSASQSPSKTCESTPTRATTKNEVNENSPSPLKRPVRNKSKPKKYGNYVDLSQVRRRNEKEIQSSDCDTDDDFVEESCLPKPKALFSDDDVKGQDMFKFKSRHTKYDLQNKVKEVISNLPKIGQSPTKTPKKNRSSITVPNSATRSTSKRCEATPRHVKDTIKKSLFSNNDIEDQDLFKVKECHTKNNLQNKVQEVMNESLTAAKSPMKTPKRNRSSVTFSNSASLSTNKTCEATPRHVKDIIKKSIIREVENDSEDSVFSDSSSDFVPDASDETESSASSSASDVDVDEEENIQKEISKLQISKNRDNKTKPKDSEYIITPDNYFMMNSSKKIATSDHTLARLKNINSTNEEIDIEISSEHRDKIVELNQCHEQMFDRWLYVLSENFNIILYGLGSKRSVLQQFQKQKLNSFPCIVVNGFFPGLTIKSILETILIDLLDNAHVPPNLSDIVSLIDTQLTENGMHLFLIIHNIDGTTLRTGKTQNTLANISQIKNVHTIATIDHINAPLLWDHSRLSKFNFTWWDVTTFLPYTEETSFENSLMTQRSGALQISSLRSVYQSLTSNAKGIFKILVEHQLENAKRPHYQGLPFKELYARSREQFLGASDVAVRAQLTEFIDHKLVKMKRSYDGNENLIIPIENVLLQQFLEEQNS